MSFNPRRTCCRMAETLFDLGMAKRVILWYPVCQSLLLVSLHTLPTCYILYPLLKVPLPISPGYLLVVLSPVFFPSAFLLLHVLFCWSFSPCLSIHLSFSTFASYLLLYLWYRYLLPPSLNPLLLLPPACSFSSSSNSSSSSLTCGVCTEQWSAWPGPQIEMLPRWQQQTRPINTTLSGK